MGGPPEAHRGGTGSRRLSGRDVAKLDAAPGANPLPYRLDHFQQPVCLFAAGCWPRHQRSPGDHTRPSGRRGAQARRAPPGARGGGGAPRRTPSPHRGGRSEDSDGSGAAAMNYREGDREAYREFLEQKRLEAEEQRQRAAAELGRLVLGGGEVRAVTVLGGAPVPGPSSGTDDDVEDAEPEEKPVGRADAGARGVRPSRKRTAGEELYLLISGHDHDNVVNSLYDVDRSDPPPGPGSAA